MATYTVDTTADIVAAGDGVLSLREALTLADASEAADTILFADSVQGRTIVLAGSQLTVNTDVTIDGGSGVTLDADEKSRVLLAEGAYRSVTLAHLTVTGGRTTGKYAAGGGVLVDGYEASLELDHVTVSGNRTEGKFARGGGISGNYVTLTDSTVSGNRTMGAFANGGGIAGHLVSLTDSTVSGNRTTGATAKGGGIIGEYVTLKASTANGNRTTGDYAQGGGIYGTYVTLFNSTVSGNSTVGDGAEGGGISGDINVGLINSTVSGNSTAGAAADGGGIHGSATLTSSTVSDNSTVGADAVGGGIYGDITVRNSIIADNAATGSTAPDVAGAIRASNGLNIFGSDVDGNTPSDRENVPASLLFEGGLADNGGPTQTIALRDAPDNPALGRADPASAYSPAADQRGVARPAPDGTNPDIGAFELNQSAPSPPPVGTTFIVTTTSDVSADDGVLSLREALALADADRLTADRVEFASAVQGHVIVLGGGELTAGSDVTVDGGADVTIDANQGSRVLLIRGLDADVVLRNLTITGGQAGGDDLPDSGDCIFAEVGATLSLDHATVSGNTADGDGGGIYGYSVTLTNSTVSGNSSTDAGGGIRGHDVALTNSTVSGNSTVGDQRRGGGISGYSVTLTNSTVSGNSTLGADADGGGIYGNYVALINTTVTGNRTMGDQAKGGGISGHNVTLTNSIVAGNTANDGIGPDVEGLLFSNGHNILGSDAEGNALGDRENVPAALLFAAIDPATGGGLLANNGGSTETIALRDATDNPALVGADSADAPAIDQRGVARPAPAGSNPDIGAFELSQTTMALNDIISTSDDDFLRSAPSADLIRGRAGGDQLWALASDDQLFLGYGGDVLAGKQGIDQMTGGQAADQLLCRRPVDAAADGGEILNFSRAQHDQIDLQPIDAKPGAAGNQAFRFIGDDAFTRAGQLRYEATADGDFLVSGNVDRDLVADFSFIVHSGVAVLKGSDFLL